MPAEPQTHARAETLLERPMFRDLVLGRRCIVPMNGWIERGSLIHVEGEELLGIAGLYDAWKLPDGRIAESFCVITVEAEEEIRHLNSRRPAILRRADEGVWLSRGETDIDRILATLHALDGVLVIRSTRRRRSATQQPLDLMPPPRQD